MPTRSARRSRRSRIGPGRGVVRAVHPRLGTRYLYCEGDVPLLFTENETNTQRIFGVPNQSAYVKDGINDAIVHGRDGVVNPEKTGTIVAAHYRLTIGPGESASCACGCRMWQPAALARTTRAQDGLFGDAFDRVVDSRRKEARRVLRRDHSGLARCRRRERDAAGPGRNAVVQTVLPLRRASVAQGARLGPLQSGPQGGAAQ